MRYKSVVSSLALWALLSAPAPAQLRLPGMGKNDEKKEIQKSREKGEKAARQYEKLKEFSLDLYEKNLDFREAVEKHYDQVQRQHSEYAFDKNVAEPARPTLVHDGDRLRLQTGLYDNKIVQDYINRVGQRLVPADAEQLFAFRLVAHPIPFAETLSTGTIYVSTGLISLLDNEAQLAYVLAHEMGHVYKDHWKLKSTLELGQEEFNQKQLVKQAWLSLLVAGAGAGIGASINGGNGALLGAGAGLVGGITASLIAFRGMNLDWDTVQENEADQVAFHAVFDRDYDVQEIPKLYQAMQSATRIDRRVGLGFVGSRRRVLERIANANELLNTKYKPEIDKKLKEGKQLGSSPEFAMVMSELKRDNGILAFYHDMFSLARTNLEYAVAIRANDPGAQYYYAKVLKLVGRSSSDQQLADQAFVKAAALDTRQRFYGAHLYRALALMNRKDQSLNPEIVRELQGYINAHFAVNSDEAKVATLLPANIDDLYDYLTQAGEVKWTPEIPQDVMSRLPTVIRTGSDKAVIVSPLTTPPGPATPGTKPGVKGVPKILQKKP